jgi:hypothetical protein
VGVRTPASPIDPNHLQAVVNRGRVLESGVTTRTKTGTSSAEPKVGEKEVFDFMVRPAGIEPATLSLEG